jgi:hypothetical protein
LYRDSIRISDRDAGDAITLTFDQAKSTAQISLSPTGDISWTPTIADTGWKTAVIQYEDPFIIQQYTFYLCVADSGSMPGYIAFATRAEDFPLTMEAGKDSLALTLAVQQGTGRPPFRFKSIQRQTGSINYLTDGIFRYQPDTTQFGYQEFTIIVTDTFMHRDSIYPRILVVPENRPCSLSLDYTGPKLGDGTLDISKVTGTYPIWFTIIDPDSPLVEQHTVTVTRGPNITSWAAEPSTPIGIILDKSTAIASYDTFTITVTDIADHSYTMTIRVYYGAVLGKIAALGILPKLIIIRAEQ